MLLFFASASLVSSQDDIPVELAHFQGKCHTFSSSWNPLTPFFIQLTPNADLLCGWFIGDRNSKGHGDSIPFNRG